MNLHGMSAERYIEILERTIRELKDQNELCTRRIAELLDEKEEFEVRANLAESLLSSVESERKG